MKWEWATSHIPVSRIVAISALLLTWSSLAHAQEEVIEYNAGPDPDADSYVALDDGNDVSLVRYSDASDAADAGLAAATYLITVEHRQGAFVQY